MDFDRSLGYEPETCSGEKMRATRELFLLATLLIAACSTQMATRGGQAALPASDVAAIRAVFDTTAAGWNRGDLAAYLSAYVESSTTMGRTGLVRGPAAIGDQMRAGFWKNGRPAQVLNYDHLEIRPLGANDALATGQYILSGNGLPERTGWFTTIWERTPVGWRMIHDHS
jgi:ketosteroid isomerase-like protein